MARSAGSMNLASLPIAILFSFVILFAVALISWRLWSLFFEILIAWVFADFTFGFFIRGGRGIGQVRPMGSRIQPMGLFFIAFTIGIIFATWVSSLLSGTILSLFESEGIGGDFLASIFACIVVYMDMMVRFYTR